MSKQKQAYIIVHRQTGKFLLNGSTLPIYWLKKIAVEKAKAFPKFIVQPILISDIEEAAMSANIEFLNKKQSKP